MSLSQDIESRIQIVDIVSRYVNLKKTGVNYKGLCPFHSERTPSFIVSPVKNIAHCFSCGKGGGPINFLKEIEKIDYREAALLLAKEAGIEMQTNYFKEKSEKGEDVYALYREASFWYHRALFLPENKQYLDYLLGRGISHETIIQFQLGCSTDSRSLYFFLKEKGFLPKFLVDSGLFVSESRDKFFGRVIFPIANHMGHVIAFTGRVLTDALPKYLNSPASEIFDKSRTLYGMNLAKQMIAKTGEVNIVEGQMDTIRMHQSGIINTVAISGTALTLDHVQFLKRSARMIYLMLDSDAAGIKATFSSIATLANQDIEVRVIQIPDGKDPDEYFKNGGNYSLLRESALTPISFFLREGGREYDISTVIGKKRLIEKCIEFLLPIRSQIEISLHIREISHTLGVAEDAVYSEYRRIQSQNRGTKMTESLSPSQEAFPENIPVYSPYDLLATAVMHYNLLDLFFQEYRYTLSDLSAERDFALLAKIIQKVELSQDELELMKVLSLVLDEENGGESGESERVKKYLLDNIRALHKKLLRHEYEERVARDPNMRDRILLELLSKARLILPGDPAPQNIFR